MSFDCLICYSLAMTRVIFGSNSLVHLFGHTHASASSLITVQYLIAGIAMPFMGYYSDKYGNVMRLLLVGAFVQLGMHVIQFMTPDCEDGCFWSSLPYWVYGLNYAIYVIVMWGSLSYLVEQKNISTAYGIFASLQNIGTTVMPLMVGYIRDNTE